MALVDINTIVCSPHTPHLSTPNTLPACLNGPKKPELPNLGLSQEEESIKSLHHHDYMQCFHTHMHVCG